MITSNKNLLTLDLGKGKPSQFHHVWLRDNCSCSECKHPDTHERTLVTSTIPDNIAPVSSHIENNQLHIIWNDGDHSSVYSLDWLKSHDYSHVRFNNDPAKSNIRLWGHEFESIIPTFDYTELRANDDVLLKWCKAIRDYGLTIVRGAPLEEGEIERFANYVAYVRETIYDRLHNVRATPGEYNAYNVASTTLELKPHTDMPNYNNPPGVQMFHFLVNESEGGSSTAVDGFNVAKQLKDTNPEAYEILATTSVNFKMNSSRGDIEAANPLLTLDTDGELKVFRFSNQLAQPANIPAYKMEAFYAAYRALGKLVEAPENMVKFKLGTGDMMATNNLRVMHGRTAFNPGTGGRHLQLSYMDMDDVMSRIRMILRANRLF